GERALWKAQALEPAPELPERGGEEGSIVFGERQLDDQRLGALEGSVERRQRGRDRCQRLVQLLQRGGDIGRRRLARADVDVRPERERQPARAMRTGRRLSRRRESRPATRGDLPGDCDLARE